MLPAIRNTRFHRSGTIFDQDFTDVPYKEINTLEHLLFVNSGDEFTAIPLPAEAQITVRLMLLSLLILTTMEMKTSF
jgi:hypothetical protein